MKKYKLTVLVFEPNEDYEQELAVFKNNSQHRNNFGHEDEFYPKKENSVRSLEVFLTEEEFTRVKKGVLEVMI